MLVAALSANQRVKNTNFIPGSVFTVSEFNPVCYKSRLYTGGKRDTSLYRPRFTPKMASNWVVVIFVYTSSWSPVVGRILHVCCSVVNKLEGSRRPTAEDGDDDGEILV